MSTPTLAEQIAALRQCIAKERKEIKLLELLSAHGLAPEALDNLRGGERRIDALEAAIRTLERLRSGVPSKGAAA